MDPAIQALMLLAILAASAIIFTVVFVLVADRELAKPESGENETSDDGERGESEGRMERERGGGSEGGRGGVEDSDSGGGRGE